MDEFVRSFLNKCNLTEWIEKFKEQEVDKESLLCLGENDIEKLIPKAGPRARFMKGLRELEGGAHGGERGQEERGCRAAVPSHQEAQTSGASWMLPEDLPSADTTCENELNVIKRKGPPAETDSPAKIKRQGDTAPGLSKDDLILDEVKNVIGGVHDTLTLEKTKLSVFLRKKIWDLGTEKRDLVGVFGKTGAGKSSLINAIVEEKDLLPTGSLQACTTVMIKVEANTLRNKYEAEIEFISKEEWKDELWSLKNLFGEISDEEKIDDEEYNENIEKMTALYGDEWKDKSPETLMEPKYFKEIPEFLRSGRKIMQVESAQELAPKVLKYTRSDSKDGQRWFWPLVKCVTVRVPNSEILEHVTLVDLPGNGDRNKSRDQMWKKIVASCSTVWIVSEINRAAADRDAWDILETTCNLMGNGGECQNIHFICTKCDDDDNTDSILTRNQKAKDLMRKEFSKLHKVKKQFNDDCFEVFTVSSKEFFKQKKLTSVETEIPKLQELLRGLNDQHDHTRNYVCGAYGILSLIKGAKLGNMDPLLTAQLSENLTRITELELQKVKLSMDKMFEVFKKCLSEGVEESKTKAELVLKKKLNPKGGGRNFHRPLKCALQNSGIHKTKKKQINLNEAISSSLTESIDEEFRRTFPNDAKSGPLYGVIHAFSLDTNRLVQQYKMFELQLTFIKTEVTNVKAKLCKNIRDRKKIIYCSLTETVKETMQECYSEAAQHRGAGSLEKMRRTVEMHLQNVKDTMFHKAKDEVLTQLKDLMDDVEKQLRDTLQESIELSFKTDHQSIPDFERQYVLVKKHFDDLSNKDDLAWPDLFD
ncbi:nuclear GTPase SLIP-GC-like isoform X2 [Boleophthalmus pectinirostris]|uniref:nuclear GTPase SLIP-GC-like isoform X2 n=1 Tax=Boleophthalmus pectinirostris TaxID=150288 RepID=UPI00242F4389|nr:nuclear GTPase SLIP-GC-like isoform X2 [Boleophthalmus pectinirostris]